MLFREVPKIVEGETSDGWKEIQLYWTKGRNSQSLPPFLLASGLDK